MDETEGSTGFNFYEGQMRVCIDSSTQIGHTPSNYLDPKRHGYGRFVYLAKVAEDGEYKNVEYEKDDVEELNP